MAALFTAFIPSSARAQTNPTFKVAWFNIQSGKGEPAMAGHTANFIDTANCTDLTKPLNAWGTGLVQAHLTQSVGNDPKVVALGLSEAWAGTCGSPERVRQVLGWKSKTSEQNGLAMVARYGFLGPEEWLQLDTTLNPNPVDTMWVLRIRVCLDALCSQTMNMFASHWYASELQNQVASYDRQAAQTVAFLQRAGGTAPHILIADLNVWEGTATCSQTPIPAGLKQLRDAGYTDAWPLLHGTAEGFTGMTNRVGCGSPAGYGWKRPDYTWSPPNFLPVSMTRFGIVPAGDEAPSDHYGLITEFPFPGVVPGVDTVAPVTSLLNPTEGQTFTGGSLTISATATDDVAVSSVEFREDGVLTRTFTAPPYQASSNIASIDGSHTIEARAYDAAGHFSNDLRHIFVSTSGGAVISPTGEIVLYAKNAAIVAGNWQVVADAQAAGGARLWNPDAAAPKLSVPLAVPVNYFDLTFNAEAGRGYRVWIRGRADRDYWGNDSVYVQFNGSVTGTGAPVYRIGTADGPWLGIEDCSGCGLSGWGWNDNGYGTGVLGPLVYFASAGPQTIRVQQREDGISIDQIVLSPSLYLTNAPGATKQDALILPLTTTNPAPVATTEIIINAGTVTKAAGTWALVADGTAAYGVAIGNPDAGAAKVTAAAAAPLNYAEFTFQAEAGRAYRLWIRGKAEKNSWANDSVFVQLSGSIDGSGTAVARIGSTSAYVVNLEDDANAGVSGWGWQDNGYGSGVLGPLVTFQTAGIQTIRVQTREDGFSFDQIVLSAQKYLTVAPGVLKNDSTIVR
jgi:hypothetical protein